MNNEEDLTPGESAVTRDFILKKYSSELKEYKTLYNRALSDLALIEEERDFLLNRDELAVYITQLEENNTRISEELRVITARERRLTLEVEALRKELEDTSECYNEVREENERLKEKIRDLNIDLEAQNDY